MARAGQNLRDLDAEFDTVGGPTTEKSLKVLKEGGTLVSMLGRPDSKLAQQHGVTAIDQHTHVMTEALKRLTQLVESGAMKIRVGLVLPLAKAVEAFQLVEEDHPRGKVVFEIKQGCQAAG